MSIRDFDPLLKKAAQKRAEQKTKRQASPGSKFKSYNAMPISLGMGNKQYKASDVSSAAELGRALQPIFQEIATDFRGYTRQVEGFLPDDLRAALEPTMELSLVYVPKDTGELADSAYLETVNFRGGARVEMGYGKGGKPAYAIYVHEIPYKHAAPTSDKFLEKAINEDYHNIVQRVTDRVRARLGG